MLPVPLRTLESGTPVWGPGSGFSAGTLLSWSFRFFPFFVNFFGRLAGFFQQGDSLDKIVSRDIPICNMPSVFLHSLTNRVKTNFLIAPAQFSRAWTLSANHRDEEMSLTFVTMNGSATHKKSLDQSALNDSSGTISPSPSSSCSSSGISCRSTCFDVEATGFEFCGALFPLRGIIPPLRMHAVALSYSNS